MIELKLFYSWQSDLPNDINRALKKAIEDTISNINYNQNDFKIVFDEATRDNPGSPDIPQTIYQKILQSDIFIGDISIINSHTDATIRKTPNPNVLIELGYASAILGWDRIIMLYNKEYGTFPSDLPFDLEKRRVSTFLIKSKDDKSGMGQAKVLLTEAIESIVKNKPSYGSNSPKNEKEVKQAKDLENLTWLLKAIHLDTFEKFLEGMPNILINNIFPFWESFHSILDSSLFHIYDITLNSKLVEFREIWGKVLSHFSLFVPSYTSKNFKLNMEADFFRNPADEQEFSILTQEVLELSKTFKNLILFLRNDYWELDIDELSRQAHQLHLKYLGNEPSL